MKKRILLLSAAATGLFFLQACDNSNSTATDSAAESTTTEYQDSSRALGGEPDDVPQLQDTNDVEVTGTYGTAITSEDPQTSTDTSAKIRVAVPANGR